MVVFTSKPQIVQEIKQQLKRILAATDWSDEDRVWLLQYLDDNDSTLLRKILQEDFNANIGTGERLNDEKARLLLETIRRRIRKGSGKVVSLTIWKRIAAVAAVILFVSVAVYLILNKNEKDDTVIVETKNEPVLNDIAPGKNKAVLTLGDNSIIVLDDAQAGTISKQGNSSVSKLNDGQIVYNLTDEKPVEVVYNTITTPRGGQYNLTLADGSKVWLNAASSLRFPASFIGNERVVEITGEAYFEVASNSANPFKVIVDDKAAVEVLGTHFNINSYREEASINTTLLEGSVKVTSVSTNRKQIIKPGQQAQLNSQGVIIVKNDPDLEEVMAWKDGKFQFGESADIATIMRQISRWYDVDFEIKGNIKQHIGGNISRDVNVSKVFEMLEMTGAVKFELSRRKVIVMPGKE